MQKGANTRSLILGQAVAQASRFGLEGLSIGALAKRLSLSKSGLFAHFGSKEELQLATLRSAQEDFANEVVYPALTVPGGLARIRTLFQNWFEWIHVLGQPGGCLLLAAAAEFNGRPGVIRDTLLRGQKELRGAVAKAVRLAIENGELPADTDAWQLAFELFGIVLAAHHDRHLFDDPRARERGVKAVERVLAAHRSVLDNVPAPGPNPTDPTGAQRAVND